MLGQTRPRSYCSGLYHHCMRQIDARRLGDFADAFARDSTRSVEIESVVAEILEEVRVDGDTALRRLTRRFDGFDPNPIEIDRGACDRALVAIPTALRVALEIAAGRIRDYHAHEGEARSSHWESGGMTVTERAVPVERAGLYAPGGRASYPSTVLMTVIPAKVAGVNETILCVPASADGAIPDVTLAAAAISECDRVMRVGGAQAIAALAYGTDSVPRVDVIAGPGNAYVAAAKRAVWGEVGIDSFAGPSEVVIVADATAPPAWVAADLVAQAEHGPGGTAVVVSWDSSVLDAVSREVEHLQSGSTRSKEIEATLASGGMCVLVESWSQAAEVVNAMAPEHVQLMCDDAEVRSADIRHAGAIFLGNMGSAAFGDYIVGVNHVLPTARSARFSSALRADTFLRHQHVVRIDASAAAALAGPGSTIAKAEGLDAHALAMQLRAQA